MGAGASAADGLKEEGNAAFKAGDFPAAVQLYTRAIAQSPDDARLYSNRAAAYLALRENGRALTDAMVTMLLRPTWVKGYYRAGVALQGLGRLEEARQALAKAAALAPADRDIVAALEAVQQSLPVTRSPGKAGPVAAVAGNGAVYTWGSGEEGSLGHGDTLNKAAPKVVDALRGQEVVDVACGTGYTVALTLAREVYAWGSNAQGQCGVGHQLPVHQPQLVPQLLGVECTAVACGTGHAVVVTPQSVFAWGLATQGQLGQTSNSAVCLVPTAIPALEGQGIRAVACGIAHTMAVDAEGRLYAFGWNNFGQLGLGHTANVVAPALVPLPPGAAVQHVACGGGHTAVVLGDGRLLTAGSGNCGQLGHGNLLDASRFQAADLPGGVKAAFVACGEEFTIVVDRDHRVYSCGLGVAGQLGHGVVSAVSRFTAIPALHDCGVELVTCSQGQCFAITGDGEIFSWGLAGSDADLVALNPQAVQATPTRLRSFGQRKVLRLECGRKHYCGVVLGTHAPACSVEGLRDAVAGERVPFLIIARDLTGALRTTGGDRFAVVPTHESGDVALDCADVDDELNGRYSGTLRLLRSGAYSVGVSYGGVAVQGSPAHLTVWPGPPHPPSCRLEPWLPSADPAEESGSQQPSSRLGVVQVIAGESLYFTLSVVDKYGNRIEEPDASCLHYRLDGAALPDAATFRQDTGELYTSCTLERAGTCTLAVTYDHPDVQGPLEVQGSPVTVHVSAAEACSTRCLADGDGLHSAVVGQLATFSIESHDAYGNTCPLPASKVTAFLLQAGHRRRCQPLPGQSWSYVPAASGAAELHVLVDRQPIPGSPFAIPVAGGSSSAPEAEGETGEAGEGAEGAAETGAERRARRQAEREAQLAARQAAVQAQRELERLRVQEMVRRRAQEALARQQAERQAEERERRRRASARRTGGGFVVLYNNFMDPKRG